MEGQVVLGARSPRWLAAAGIWWIALAFAGACSSGARSSASTAPVDPAAATAAPATAADAAAQLGGKPPLARVGEKLTYRISIQGVELAEFAIVVGQDAEGLVVQSVARSTGVGALIKKVETQFISYIDAQTGKPRRFRSEERAGRKDATLERSDARIAERQGDAISVRVRRGEGDAAAEQTETQKVHTADIWDLNAVMIALRQFEAPLGTKLAFESFRSRFVWKTELTVAKREQLSTELGRVSTLRFEGWAHGLRRDGELNDEPERRFSLWISDDADRIPVLLVGVTDYGDIRMEITSYTPPGEPFGSQFGSQE
jgi:hypothetical protein